MPPFSKPYRNLEQNEPIRKDKLIREIAARTYIKESVVDEVLDTFRKIATEEIVNKASFNFYGLFSVSNYHTKEVNTGKGVVPERVRLKTKLSSRVKKIWNARFNNKVKVFESYEECEEKYLSDEGNKYRDSISLIEDQETIDNPMLDDNDEY